MNKSTKGLIAAAAGGTLLLGGAGSLAFWTASTDISGTALTSGHLKIHDVSCASATWKLDGGADIGPSTRIVPGDTITKTCQFTVDGVGDHMTVNLGTATPGWSSSNALTSELQVASKFDGSVSGADLADNASITKDETITATLTVTYPTSSTSTVAQDLTGTLNQITLTVTQGHSA